MVRDHLGMLSSQHLASALRPLHPSHVVVMAPCGSRAMKETLGSRRGDSVAPYFSNGTINAAAYRVILKRIQTDAIAASFVKLSVKNPVLDAVPPEPYVSQKRLSCIQRIMLSQLH